MVKSKQILEHGSYGRVDFHSHPSRNLRLFPEAKYTLHRLLCPMTSLLSLFGFNVTCKKGFCSLAWRCFVTIFIVITSINRIYLFIGSALSPSVTSLLTAQMFLIVVLLETIFTVLWMFRNICRLRKCLESIFLILNYVWNHSNSKNCKSPYKRFKMQMLPCVIFTMIVTFTPVTILPLYYTNLSTTIKVTGLWGNDYHTITSRLSEIAMCCLAIPFTMTIMGLFEGICCMLSLVLSEHVDLTSCHLRMLYQMDGEYEAKSQNVRKNPSIAHGLYIGRLVSKVNPIQHSLTMHSKALDTQMQMQTSIISYYDINDDISSLLYYHHYLMNTVRQVDELFSGINLIWYSCEILQIVLCVRASDLNVKPNLVWLITSFICTFPLIVRSLYAAKVNSQSMKLLERNFTNSLDSNNFVPNKAQQLQHYCLGLSMNPAQLTVYGLFAIFNNLILTIGGTILSYGIVLYGG